MNDLETKDLCLALMKADAEEDVITLLRTAGLWTNQALWRYYGDRDTNYNAIGNQQSRPDAALVEKIVNAVDARLMNECLVRGIDPNGPGAPGSIQQAVARFFDDSVNQRSASAGRLSEWSDSKRTEVARGITLAATGMGPREGKPCLSIADCGEGQTPDQLPETVLSLDRSNKLRIPFVQGKFNMGGTGALKFCGRHHLQFVLSKRNPKLANGTANPSDSKWGFTIVRRENPEDGRRSSLYTYLAPLYVQGPHSGGVLRFSAEEMPLFPDGPHAYAKGSSWGTLIKLYEYAGAGYSNTNILLKDGLLSRLDILLPDAALPIRLHECRSTYRGHKGSFDTTLSGLSVRLNDNKGDNLEEGFPDSSSMRVMGEPITTTIYAFRKGRAETYRKNEGIIFTVNGQTHGHLTPDFFRRKQVGLSYLSDSILLIVDCSQFSNTAREDLFMNSRDRLSGGELRQEIEDALEELLKHHEGLRSLKERRRREEIESKVEDSKPLADILKSLLERYPSLSSLFLPGSSISNPFKTVKAQVAETVFEGKRYPSHFRFKGQSYGYELHRDCHINLRCRVAFDTDADNDYFSRVVDPGNSSLLFVMPNGERQSVDDYTLNPYNGVATLSVRLPQVARVGDTIEVLSTVTDASRVDPFLNTCRIHVKEAVKPNTNSGERREPRAKGEGKPSVAPSGIQLPTPTRVYESEWAKHGFDQHTALIVIEAGESAHAAEGEPNGKTPDIYDFFVNMDNVHLKRHMKYVLKGGEQDDRITQTRFEIGLVLVGLALINQGSQQQHDFDETTEDEKPETNIEDQVASVTKALAPFLLPMIEALGALDLDEQGSSQDAGEAT